MGNIKNELYHYGCELDEVTDILEENGGEITEEVESRMLALTQKGVVVADDMYAFIASRDNIAEMCNTEIKRLQAIKKRAEGAKSSVKGMMLQLMMNKGIEAFKSDLHSMKVSAGRESLEVTDEDALYEPYRSRIDALADVLPPWIKVKVEIGKTELTNAIKNGELVQGAEIVRNPSLLIK